MWTVTWGLRTIFSPARPVSFFSTSNLVRLPTSTSPNKGRVMRPSSETRTTTLLISGTPRTEISSRSLAPILYSALVVCRADAGAASIAARAMSPTVRMVLFMGGSLEFVGQKGPDEIAADLEAGDVRGPAVEIVGQAEPGPARDPQDGADGEVPVDVRRRSTTTVPVPSRISCGSGRIGSPCQRTRRRGRTPSGRSTGRPGHGCRHSNRRSRDKRRPCRGRNRG